MALKSDSENLLYVPENLMSWELCQTVEDKENLRYILYPEYG